MSLLNRRATHSLYIDISMPPTCGRTGRCTVTTIGESLPGNSDTLIVSSLSCPCFGFCATCQARFCEYFLCLLFVLCWILFLSNSQEIGIVSEMTCVVSSGA